MKTWMVIDCSGLAHQAFHALPELSHNGQRTEVVFGFFKQLEVLEEQLQPTGHVFCFDRGESVRVWALPQYKSTRKTKEKADPKYAAAKGVIHEELVKLNLDYLPGLGYRNLLFAFGFEADDVIASVVQNLPEEEQAVIVGSDGDFLQLLSENVSVWNPRKGKMVTIQSFQKEYGIPPKWWARVKALAGCLGDDIPGIAGVGEISAVKYLRGELKAGKMLDKIEAGLELAKRTYYPLVKLPYPGTPVFNKLHEDEVTEEKWQTLTKRLGFRNLRERGGHRGKQKREGLWI